METENSKVKRPLGGLLLAQFFGAFNDNAWKLMVFTLATRGIMVATGGVEIERTSQLQATLTLLLFLLPMLIFSIPAGTLADRLSKRTVIIGTKILEVILMGSAAISLLIAPTHLLIPYILLAMMGAQSALFGPAKYGILPELLPHGKLSHGNGLMEMWTMLAIIAGTGLGPMLLVADAGGTRPGLTWLGALWLSGLSVIGLFGTLAIPKVAPANTSSIGVAGTIRKAWSTIQGDKVLWMAILGNVAYWLILSLLGQNVLVYAKALVQDLAKGEMLQGIPPASYGVGIAIGAFLAGRMSGDRIEYGFIPLGTLGFAVTSLMLGWFQPAMGGTVTILIMMGIFSGLLIVPLHAIVQWRAPAEQRGGIIALGNVFDVVGMIVGSLAAAGMTLIGLDLRMMLILSAFLVVLATVLAIRILPAALVRLVFIILTHTFYRIRVTGSQHVPKKGPALLVSNHMSLVDAFFVMATVDRPVRFIMDTAYYKRRWVKPLADLLGVIPISSTSGPRAIIEGLRRAGEALDNGHLVCIFPEGQISRTGFMQPFRRGAEVIMKDRDYPIIPIHLDRVWGSIFSYQGEKFVSKWPHKIPYPVSVSVGPPLPSTSPLSTIRQAIKELQYDAWIERKKDRMPIHHAFIRHARRAPWRTSLIEEERGKWSYLKTLTSAVALARALRQQWKGQPYVGILLPSSIPAVVTNLAATMSGHAVVNLNFTAGSNGMRSAIQQADLQTIITSRKFLEKANCDLPEEANLLYLEDLLPTITFGQRIWAMLLSLFTTYSRLEKASGAKKRVSIDDTLTVIFTSGSTGDPKGVVLNHFNVDSNVEAVSQVAHSKEGLDKLLGTLPLFHSFGYMSMWLGLNHSLGIVLHPNPLDAPTIGPLIEKHKVTMIMTTPTFLKIYMRRIMPGQLGSVRCIITGAEKLPKSLSDNFLANFGIRPIEGYGATECSPVIATSTLDVRKAGVFQPGSYHGTVGQPLPGVVTCIVDPENFEELPLELEGMLLVKGPNVMQGYLGQEELTEKVMHDGWYITGDIAMMNADGYLKITDRLSRFSKIGGEMVPHGSIEEALHTAANASLPVFAVTAIPDASKGERLAVLHTLNKDKIPAIHEKLSAQGLPNLFIPRLDHFIKVEELPMLGTGKLDLRTIKARAAEFLAKK